VSDDIIVGLVKARLKEPDTAHGYLFDGFPRTIPQAEAMKRFTASRSTAYSRVDVPEDDIIERMSGRRVHVGSGRTYHICASIRRHVPGVDDITGDPLIQRDDDREDTVRKRLDVYQAQTRALVDYYTRWSQSGDARAPAYRRISGVGTVDEIRDRVFDALDN
jgi:adenylate kinase